MPKRKAKMGPIHYRPETGQRTYLRPVYNLRHRGRPKEHCRRCNMTLPLDVITILESTSNRSALVAYLVRLHDHRWRRSLRVLERAGFSDQQIIWFSRVCSKMPNIHVGLSRFAFPRRRATVYGAPPEGTERLCTVLRARPTRYLCLHLEVLISELLAGNRALRYALGIYDDLPGFD